MKININEIAPRGLTIKENLDPAAFDLETDLVKFRGPLKVEAEISKITNAVTVNLSLSALMRLNCSRCLNEFEMNFNKALRLNYTVEKQEFKIDLGPDIREEIIVDYPMKPLCSQACKGLCPKCGRNLNEGPCSCVKRAKGA